MWVLGLNTPALWNMPQVPSCVGEMTPLGSLRQGNLSGTELRQRRIQVFGVRRTR